MNLIQINKKLVVAATMVAGLMTVGTASAKPDGDGARKGNGPRAGDYEGKRKRPPEQAQEVGEGERRRKGPPPHMREKILEQYDADGDGRLNHDERMAARQGMEKLRAERKAKMLAAFDQDGDGELSQEERAAVRKKHQQQMQARRAEWMNTFDADDDGKLSESERQALREALQKHQDEGRGRPGDQG